jgi:outer membrane protein TolC
LRKLISVLIAGDEKAKSEIQQADAYVAQAVGRRLAGEQAVFEARQALGVAMGLDRAGLRYAPLAAEPFPGPNGLEHVSNNQDRLIAAALELRADYRASIKAQESAQAIMDAARLDLLPQMNFQIKASSFGGDTDVSFQGFEHSFFGHQTGVSAVGQLQFDWPIENRVARGNFVTTTAEKRQAEVQTSQLESNIVSGVLVSIDALMSGARQWLEAREAVSAYERATDTEEKKYKAGVSTLLDVIDTEDRELEEMLTEVTARQQIAVAYAQLRFQSGTMLTGDGKSVDITPDVLETVPSVAQVPPPGPLFRFKGSAQAR